MASSSIFSLLCQLHLGLTCFGWEHFREAVLINPLLEKGLIKLTISDKPTSSLQRYDKADIKSHPLS